MTNLEKLLEERKFEAFEQIDNKSEFEVNQTNAHGQNRLMQAVQANDIELVDFLLKMGADLNQRDKTMLTPWICAGANGFHHLVHRMSQNQPDVNKVNRFGGTILLPSSEKGYLQSVLLSLKAGVPVNHQNYLGWSALQEAIILGNGGTLYKEIVFALLDQGADTSLTDFEDKSALDWAVDLGQDAMLEILKKDGNDRFAKVRHYLANFETVKARTELESIEDISDEEKYFYLGYIAQVEQKYQEAESLFNEGLEKTSESEFYLYLAILYREMMKKDLALEAFDQAITSASQYQSDFYLYHKSNYLREIGHHAEAVAVMDDLLSRNPHRYDYLFHKANSLRSLGAHDEALAAMLKAIDITPDNMLYHFHAGQSLVELGKIEEAVEKIQHAISVDPKEQYKEYLAAIQ